MQLALALGIAILALACLIDLPIARKVNQTLGGFFLMNGRLKLPGFVASVLSANLSIGNFLIFVASWGYLFGWGGLAWFIVNLALNVGAYLLFIPAFRGYIEDPKNSGTIHEFLATKFAGTQAAGNYARRVRFVASATTILGLLFAIVFELHLATDVLVRALNASTPIVDPIVVFGVLTALICVYSGIGGFHTLIFTDVVQSIAMIVGTLAIVPAFWKLAALPTAEPLRTVYPLTASSFDIGWPSIVSICVVGSGWFLVAMDQWQRTCATRDASRTKLGMLWYFVSIAGFAVVYALIGMYDKATILPSLPEATRALTTNGSNPLLDFLFAPTAAQVPPWASGLFVVALLAAAMSTANTFLIVSGHSFVSDLLIAVAKRVSMNELPPAEDRAFLALARGTIIGMGVFVIAAWLIMSTNGLLTDPLSFFFIAYSIQFALLAPMVCARLPRRWQPSGMAVFHSVWVGVLVALVYGFSFWRLVQAGHSPIWGIAVGDWMALTPVATLVAGLIVLALLNRARGEAYDSSVDGRERDDRASRVPSPGLSSP